MLRKSTVLLSKLSPFCCTEKKIPIVFTVLAIIGRSGTVQYGIVQQLFHAQSTPQSWFIFVDAVNMTTATDPGLPGFLFPACHPGQLPLHLRRHARQRQTSPVASRRYCNTRWYDKQVTRATRIILSWGAPCRALVVVLLSPVFFLAFALH